MARLQNVRKIEDEKVLLVYDTGQVIAVPWPGYAPDTVPAQVASYLASGGVVIELDIEEITDEVDRLREVKINGGFVFGDVLFDSRPENREDIAGAYSLALGVIMSGGGAPGDVYWHVTPDLISTSPEPFAPDLMFVWIAHDNSHVPMDAPTVLAFGAAALVHKKSMIFAAASIKARLRAGEPLDYTDPALWP
jgi:hypothetical protein